MSVGAGVAIALIAIPGVRATTGVSEAAAVLEGLARGLFVVVPLAVGLYACRRPSHARFGWLLVAWGGLWFVASLSSSASPTVYSVGRLTYWLEELCVAYVLLAFPTGRLETRFDRIVIALAATVVATLFLPTALFVHQYPVPVPVASCAASCPHNAFMVVQHQPAFIAGFLTPFREVLIVGLYLVVAARLAQRIRASNTLMRRTVAPMLAPASLRMLLFAAAIPTRGLAPDGLSAQLVMWTLALLVPAIALAFLLGLVRWRMFVTSAILNVHARLRGMPGPQHVRDVLADAFEDPRLGIGYWIQGRRRWLAADGRAIEAPAPGSGQYLTEVRDGSERVAILHDVTLRDERAFLDTAASLVTFAFASDELTARAERTLREVNASRARIAAAADSERRQIERELHEGAQQRVAALRIQLELAAERPDGENPDEAASLRRLGANVDQAIDDMRSIAFAIYPAVLSDRGLADAVRAAALRSPIYGTVSVIGVTDYPQPIAAAVYFCCVEALHRVAEDELATSIEIVLEELGSALSFAVSDNGDGGWLTGLPDLDEGIVNMRDRLAAVGGELKLNSGDGHGTWISGRVPLPTAASAEAGSRRGHPRQPAAS